MVKAIGLVLLEKDNLLLLSDSSNNRLPIIKIEDNEVMEEKLRNWLEEKINIKDIEILKGDREIVVDGYSITTVFIDATDKNIILEGNRFVFENCNYIYINNSVDEGIIESALKQCKNKNYNSEIIEKLSKVSIRGKNISNIRKREIEEIDNKKSLGLIFGSILAGIMISIFLFSYFGISFPIFYGYLIGFFFLSNKVKNKSFMGYFLVGAGFLVSCTFGIYTNELFRVLNLLIVPISIFTGFILLTYKDIQFKFISLINEFIERIIGNSLSHIPSLFKVTKSIISDKNMKKNSSNNSKEIFIGILISIPLVIVLIILLSGADEMFGYYLKNIFNVIKIDNFEEIFNKLIVFTITFLLTFGLYYSLAVEKSKNKYNYKSKKILNEVTVVTVLTFVSLVYLIFTKIQVSYLYLEKALPSGYDFSQYARSGFFQLVFLVVINLMLIVLFKTKTKIDKKSLNKVLKGAYTLITVLTFNMAISAIYKMNLYIAAFGYTRLRLLVQVFTVFLCGVLILLILFILKDKDLFKPIVILATVMYITLNYINIDNYIVKKNLEVMTVTSEIDVHYLTTLSLDAYKAVTEGKELGKIPSNEYNDWINNRINNNLKWYSYNYFNKKCNY